MKQSKWSRLLTVLVLASLVLVLIPKTMASCPPGTVCWTGVAGDGKWETARNWSSGSVPGAYSRVSISLPFSSQALIVASSHPTLFTLTIGNAVTVQCTGDCELTASARPSQSLLTSVSQLPYIANAGTITNSGEISVIGGSLMVSAGDAAVEIRNSGNITNSGIISVESGGARITNSGTMTNSNGGSISLDGGSAEIRNHAGGNITNSGTISMEGGSAGITNDVDATIINSQTISVEGGRAHVTNSGNITNNNGGRISVSDGGAGITNDPSGIVTNLGTITITGGGATISNHGRIFNCGSISGQVTGNTVIGTCPSIQVTTTTQPGTTTLTGTMELGTTAFTAITTVPMEEIGPGLPTNWLLIAVVVAVALLLGVAIFLLRARSTKADLQEE